MTSADWKAARELGSSSSVLDIMARPHPFQPRFSLNEIPFWSRRYAYHGSDTSAAKPLSQSCMLNQFVRDWMLVGH